MGLPPPLGASSRRVRCRLWVRSQAIHPAAGCLLRRGRSITPRALYYAAGYSSRRGLLTRRRRYFAAGYSFRRRLFCRGLFFSPRSINSPQALFRRRLLTRRRRYFAAGYSFRRRLSISPQALYYAAGYSFRRRRFRLKLHHRRHLSRDRDERAAAGKHPTVFNQVAVLGEFGREFKQGVSIIGQCRKIVL